MKRTITAIAIVTLFSLSLVSTDAATRTADTARRSAPDGVEFELKEHSSQTEAAQAGFLREMRARRWLREQREARRLQNFYCNSGPAVQAALEFFWNVDVECPEPEKPAPTCRHASRVADPCR